MSGGGIAPNGNTSNLPLFGTPEQQMADPLGLFPGTPPPPASSMGSLGLQTTMPMSPNGAFMQPQGNGFYNQMAMQSAGPLFNTGIQNPANANRSTGPVAAPIAPQAPGAGAKGVGQSFGSAGHMLNQATSLNGHLPGIGGGNGQTAIRALGAVSGLGGFL